jgi:thymidylate synthase (FAD)
MRAAYTVYQDTVRVMVDAYDDLLALGVAPEQARMILPLSSMTEWYWTGSLAAWARVYRLRSGEDAQAETSEIAEDIGDILRELYPVSWAALTGEADAS